MNKRISEQLCIAGGLLTLSENINKNNKQKGSAMMRKMLLVGTINMLGLCSMILAEEVAQFRGPNGDYKRHFGEKIQTFLIDLLDSKMSTAETNLDTKLNGLETDVKTLVCQKYECVSGTLESIECVLKQTEDKVDCVTGVLACTDNKLSAIECLLSKIKEKVSCLEGLIRCIEGITRETECIERKVNCKIDDIIQMLNIFAASETDCSLVDLNCQNQP